MSNKGAILNRLKQIENRTDEKLIAKYAYDVWYRLTPVKSGNAKNKTSLVNNEIRADYAYAQRLDQGWSKQFGGQGMSKPTLAAVQEYIDKKV